MSDPSEEDPFWFLDTRRLPLPLQLWVLFSFFPTFFVLSYLPYQQEDLSDYLSKLPFFVVCLIKSCMLTVSAALFATILHGQLKRRREQ